MEAPSEAQMLGERSVLPAASHWSGRVWLVFADLLANRVFFECGIVERLHCAFPSRLTAVFVVHEKHVEPWLGHLEGIPLIHSGDLIPVRVPAGERIVRRLDIELDKRIGFYPLAIRHSLRTDSTEAAGLAHTYPFLDSSRVGPLPRWRIPRA
jgi:hypothetical protein